MWITVEPQHKKRQKYFSNSDCSSALEFDFFWPLALINWLYFKWQHFLITEKITVKPYTENKFYIKSPTTLFYTFLCPYIKTSLVKLNCKVLMTNIGYIVY